MNIALTGSTGFIGRHVVGSLTARGHRVVEILRPGMAEAALTPNFVEFNLDRPPRDAFKRLGSPEVLVHLAWGGLPNYGSIHHVESELPRQVKFLSALIDQGLPRLVVSGTCFEYGLKEGQLKESDPVSPVTEYARAKTLLHERLRQSHPDADIVWARLFYPYGPGQASQSLYSQFQRACEAGAESFPMSPGDQLRDYLPVEMMADHVAELSLARGVLSQVVNVGSGKPIAVRDLVAQWAAERDADIQLQTGSYPYPEHEPKNAWAKIAVLESILGHRSHDTQT